MTRLERRSFTRRRTSILSAWASLALPDLCNPAFARSEVPGALPLTPTLSPERRGSGIIRGHVTQGGAARLPWASIFDSFRVAKSLLQH